MIGTAFDDEEPDKDRERRRALQRLLVARFGRLSPAALEKLASWPANVLEEKLEAVITARSLSELGLDEAALYRKE